MRAAAWGNSGHRGGVKPWAVAATGDHLVLISLVARKRTVAVGLRLDAEGSRTQPVWERELPQGPDHVADSGEESFSLPSVVSAGGRRAYIASGGARLLVAADTGAVLAEATAPASPTPNARPAPVGSELLVPEWDELAAYDAATLALRWRRPTPRRMWAGSPADGLCPLRKEGVAGLWHLGCDALFEIPGTRYISAAPTVVGSVVVLSCGGGAGERLIAVDSDTGAVVWSADTPPPNPNGFKAPAPAAQPLDTAGSAYGDWVISSSQIPSVDARVAATGALVWRAELAYPPGHRSAAYFGQPTALALVDGTAWVATGARVLALDARSGVVEGEVDLNAASGADQSPPGAADVVSLMAMPAGVGPPGVIAVAWDSTVYVITR